MEYVMEFTPEEAAQFGEARLKDIIFEGVYKLWLKRKKEGLTMVELAARMEWPEVLVNHYLSGPGLSGPGSWTFKIAGAFIQALNGEAEFKVEPL